jgi:hypothetical protein
MKKQLMTLAVGIVLLTSSGFAQEDPVVQWGKATTAKISHFLPQPAAGFIPHEPWKPNGHNDIETSLGNMDLNFKYLIPRAEQTWWYGDPDLAKEIAATEKERANLEQSQQHNLQSQQMADVAALQKQYNDLLRQNKMTEAQAIAATIEQLTAGDEAKSQALDDRLSKLHTRARSLRIQIIGNETLAINAGYHLAPSGSLAGHPLYRGTAKSNGPDSQTVYLLVYAGPAGFQNPPVNGPSIVGLECFVVIAHLESRADTVQADEAAAKLALASIDYNGLTKLIAP